jgi:hypothetical protein
MLVIRPWGASPAPTLPQGRAQLSGGSVKVLRVETVNRRTTVHLRQASVTLAGGNFTLKGVALYVSACS